MADDKRGSHLTLSLERLETLAGRPLTRIGLSATQKPIEVVADFLGGAGRPTPLILQVPQRRELDLAVEVPASELEAVTSTEVWKEIYDRVVALSHEHRSTLVFVNTRRLSERVAHSLAERLGPDLVAAHHGSLSRKTRLDAERRLKAGELRVLVATASLELGIDIGSVDLVCQIGSPRAIGVALQRIGRAGHWRGAVPKGRLFATTRDELVECAALVHAIRTGDLDRLTVPDAPLDILAQQVVAMCAAEDWDEDTLFTTVTGAYPYRALRREAFDEVIEMLSEGISSKRGRYGAYLHRDRVNGRLRGRRGARLAAITSGGAIPETGLYTVVAEPEGTVVGTVDEDFAVESLAGDVMLLGNTSWRIRRVSTAGRVIVEDAHGAAPSIPFWRGEAPGRTAELSEQVSHVRETVSALAAAAAPGDAAKKAPTVDAAISWLIAECGLDRAGAEQLVDHLVVGRAVLGAVPTTKTVIAERFFDEGGGMQLVIHTPFGARINKAWGLALRKRFCRTFNFELQAAATDNGINISLAEQHSFPLADVFAYLRPPTVKGVLEQAALASPIFGTRWRWDAGRALALLRFRGGKKLPIHLLRLQSDDLLAAVFPDVAACQETMEGDIQIPDHPLVREVMKDVLTEAMDLDGLIGILDAIGSGQIRTVAVDTPVPSVFSHEILNANPYAYLDDAPLEERRARAVEMRRVLPPSVLEEVGGLDQEAIEQVREQAWPDVRDHDELHDALLTLVALPLDVPAGLDSPRAMHGTIADRIRESLPSWTGYFETLQRDRRAGRATVHGRSYWVPAERAAAFARLFPSVRFDAELPEFPAAARSAGASAGAAATGSTVAQATDAASAAAVSIVQGWLSHIGPATCAGLSQLLGLDERVVNDSVLGLEASGWALRGRFVSAVDPATTQWCERRLLARIHRLTLGALRREIAPVTSSEFMRWLLEWQHVTPGSQVHGENGTFEVLRQMQGFEAPANAWEPQILARRIVRADPADLDRLCFSGAVGWGRLSPHPASLEPVPDAPRTRRVIPSSVAPITFFVRGESDWMDVIHDGRSRAEPAAGLGAAARDVLAYLQRHGASFFADITRGVRGLKSEIEAGLWELVTAGLVTADGFDNLRALVDPRRRAGHGNGRHKRPRDSAGRWALLPHGGAHVDRAAAIESSCWMLLARYGVVFRELLVRESNRPAWRDLLIAFRRLEDRGEVRGGRFVSGFVGEQFALPVAVESLRALRHRPESGQIVTIAAADPLNLVGVLLPGERVPANSGRYISLQNGVVIDVDAPAYTLAIANTAS
jgi:ATP-dependent Lhr-like helicase